MSLHILKRNGTHQPVSADKIRARLETLAFGLDKEYVDIRGLVDNIMKGLTDNLQADKLDELVAQTAAYAVTRHPDYGLLGGRLAVSSLHKTTSASVIETFRRLYRHTCPKTNKPAPLIADDVMAVIEKHQETLQQLIDYRRDLNYEYFGYKTLERSYLLRVEVELGKLIIVERPQHMLMRVAVGIHLDDMTAVKETYDLLSQGIFTHATPTLFNAGTPKPQMSSCFLVAMKEDSIEGIYDTLKQCAQISKSAGGIGLHCHCIRATGSYIAGTNGTSNGLVPMLRVWNNTARYVDQCFAGDTIVYTKAGPKHIKDVVPGDEVINAQGTFGRVKRLDAFVDHDFSDSPIIAVQPKGSMSLVKVTENHLFYAAKTTGFTANGGQGSWESVKQLIDNGTIQFDFMPAKSLDPKRGDFIAFPIPKYVAADECSADGVMRDLDDWYFYGAVIGGGCTEKNSSQVYVSLNNTSKQHLAESRIRAYLQKKGIESGMHPDPDPNASSIRVVWSRAQAAALPFDREDFCDADGEKRINPKFLHLPEVAISQIIKGIVDADGSEGTETQLEMTSLNVIQSLRYMLLRLGCLTSGKIRNWVGQSPKGSAPAYALRIPAVDKVATLLGIAKSETLNSCCVKIDGADFVVCRLESKLAHSKRVVGAPVVGEPAGDEYLYIDEAQGDAAVEEEEGGEGQGTEYHFKFDTGKDPVYDLVIDVPGDDMPNSEPHEDGLIEVGQDELRCYLTEAGIAHNGGGKRKGAFAVYLEPWHSDIFDFLMLKRSTGKDENRARDLFYGLWIPDLFMKRVEAHAQWTLMDPHSAPGLFDTYGEEFEALYEKYEKEGRGVKTVPAHDLWFAILESQIETGTPYMLYKDACNKKSNQQNLGTIKCSNLCTEIIEYTSPDEIAVCNLASLALPAFVDEQRGSFDHQRLFDVTKVATRNLNKVIDRNFYPVEEARRSNMRHRPIGLGVQGLADAFIMLRMPFTSAPAQELNEHIFETIYFAAVTASVELAEKLGPYETFAGSPASKGQFQFDLWGKKPTSGRWDWETLRARMVKSGLRNSLLLAPMPTASTAQILGNTEAFECQTSNIYVRRVLSGEFPVVNKYLVTDLIRRGMWTEDVRNEIIAHNGSIQRVACIPQDIKDLYKVVWEIKMKDVIDMAAARGKYICQSQSLNLFLESPKTSQLTSMHFYAWKAGLKTGMYYLRSRPAVDAIKFTVDQKRLAQTSGAAMNSQQSTQQQQQQQQQGNGSGTQHGASMSKAASAMAAIAFASKTQQDAGGCENCGS